MDLNWAHTGTAVTAAFLASLVEAVEALTVVLAVGAMRGWRSALVGCAAAVLVLLVLVAALGPALARIPLRTVQVVVGTLLVLFGLRWLRKAILRAAGYIAKHDEEAAFRKSTDAMSGAVARRWDRVAIAATFQITMLEGTEVVFIVIAIAAGGRGMLVPASLGALAAVVVVAALGAALHRPLARVPENALKFVVGILLSALGTFWAGEGMGLGWPGADWSILVLIAGYLLVAGASILLCKRRARAGQRRLRVAA